LWPARDRFAQVLNQSHGADTLIEQIEQLVAKGAEMDESATKVQRLIGLGTKSLVAQISRAKARLPGEEYRPASETS